MWSLNAYAWEFARRAGDGAGVAAALPMAQEAVECARAVVVEAADQADVTMLSVLAASLDTLANIHARRGDTDLALGDAREARTAARRLADGGDETHQGAVGRADKLITLLEQGADVDFDDRG